MTNQTAAAIEEQHDEGHSVAAWVGVAIMLVGFTIGTFGLWFDSMATIIVGIVAIVIGAIAWPALKALGFGPKKH